MKVTGGNVWMHGCHQEGVPVDREYDSPMGGMKVVRKVF